MRVGMVMVGKKPYEFRQSKNTLTSDLLLYWKRFKFQSPPQKHVACSLQMLFKANSKYGKKQAKGYEGDLYVSPTINPGLLGYLI